MSLGSGAPAWAASFLLLLLGLAFPVIAARAAEPLPILRTAREVRELSADEASRGREADLTGVVLGLAEPPGRAAIIWDGTDGIYFFTPHEVMRRIVLDALVPGDCVRVKGRTVPGGYAPFLEIESFEQLGKRPLPAPRRLTAEDLFSKGLDAQWITVSGVVREIRSVRNDEVLPDRHNPGKLSEPFRNRLKLTLAMGDRLVAVLVYGLLNPDDYVDAEVELTGICVNQHNARRQFLNPLIIVPKGVPIQVIKPPPAGGGFAGPPTSSEALFSFRPDGISPHRVHLDGVVLHHGIGTGIWVRNNGQGLFVETDQKAPLAPGDLVKVAGFAQRWGFSPNLANSVYVKTGEGEPPKPTLLQTRKEVAARDCDLAEVRARLVEEKVDGENRHLRLAWEGLEVDVQCTPTSMPGGYASLEPGSILTVAGICLVRARREGPLSGFIFPDGFSLVVRSPADIAVVKPAPWWSSRRVIVLLLALLTGLAAVLVTVSIISGRKFRREKELRRLEIAQYSARLAERTRMARDIHDTVAQGLGAISLQLELAEANRTNGAEKLTGHLSMAQKLVRSSMTEVRSYIRQLRTQNQQDVALASALEEMLRSMVESTSLQPEFRLEGEVLRLPSDVEAQVLRIVQEMILNAVRHSCATKLSLTITHTAGELAIELSDDGRGFDPAVNYCEGGHFGLTGMRERSALIGADLQIHSAAGRGTRLRLVIPRTGGVSPEAGPPPPVG